MRKIINFFKWLDAHMGFVDSSYYYGCDYIVSRMFLDRVVKYGTKKQIDYTMRVGKLRELKYKK